MRSPSPYLLPGHCPCPLLQLVLQALCVRGGGDVQRPIHRAAGGSRSPGQPAAFTSILCSCWCQPQGRCRTTIMHQMRACFPLNCRSEPFLMSCRAGVLMVASRYLTTFVRHTPGSRTTQVRCGVAGWLARERTGWWRRPSSCPLPVPPTSTPACPTDPDAKVASWWDYGYQTTAMANRTVIVDNNTWNNTHIATVSLDMAVAWAWQPQAWRLTFSFSKVSPPPGAQLCTCNMPSAFPATAGWARDVQPGAQGVADLPQPGCGVCVCGVWRLHRVGAALAWTGFEDGAAEGVGREGWACKPRSPLGRLRGGACTTQPSSLCCRCPPPPAALLAATPATTSTSSCGWCASAAACSPRSRSQTILAATVGGSLAACALSSLCPATAPCPPTWALCPAGNYRVDDQAGKALLDSTMWK